MRSDTLPIHIIQICDNDAFVHCEWHFVIMYMQFWYSSPTVSCACVFICVNSWRRGNCGSSRPVALVILMGTVLACWASLAVVSMMAAGTQSSWSLTAVSTAWHWMTAMLSDAMAHHSYNHWHLTEPSTLEHWSVHE